MTVKIGNRMNRLLRKVSKSSIYMCVSTNPALCWIREQFQTKFHNLSLSHLDYIREGLIDLEKSVMDLSKSYGRRFALSSRARVNHGSTKLYHSVRRSHLHNRSNTDAGGTGSDYILPKKVNLF